MGNPIFINTAMMFGGEISIEIMLKLATLFGNGKDT